MKEKIVHCTVVTTFAVGVSCEGMLRFAPSYCSFCKQQGKQMSGVAQLGTGVVDECVFHVLDFLLAL